MSGYAGVGNTGSVSKGAVLFSLAIDDSLPITFGGAAFLAFPVAVELLIPPSPPVPSLVTTSWVGACADSPWSA